MTVVTFTSGIQVSNLALTLVGANSIQSFEDDSQEAQIMKQNYELWVIQCFEKYQWRFAIHSGECSKLETAPIPQWEYGYKLPADLIQIIAVFKKNVSPETLNGVTTYKNAKEGEPPYQNYQIFANNTLCTDYGDGIIVNYKKRVPEATWPASFVNFVSYYMAIQLCALVGRQFELQKQLVALTFGSGSNSVYQTACDVDASQSCTQLLKVDFFQDARESY